MNYMYQRRYISFQNIPGSENGAKIVKQAKEIKELQVKVASLDISSKNQEAEIKQLNDDLIKLRSMFIFLNLIFYQASHKPSYQIVY